MYGDGTIAFNWTLDPWTGQFRQAESETAFRQRSDPSQYRLLTIGLPIAVALFLFLGPGIHIGHEHGPWSSLSIIFSLLLVFGSASVLVFGRKGLASRETSLAWILVALSAGFLQVVGLAMGTAAWPVHTGSLVIALFAVSIMLPVRPMFDLLLGLELVLPATVYGLAIAPVQGGAASLGIPALALGLFFVMRRQAGIALRGSFAEQMRSDAAKREIEHMFRDLQSQSEAIEGAAARNIDLMEEIDFLRETAETQTQFLRVVLDSIVQGVAVYNADWTLVVWNRRFEELLDLPEGFVEYGMRIDRLLQLSAERGDYGDGDVEQLVKTRSEVVMALSQNGGMVEHHRGEDRILEIRSNPLSSGGFVLTFSDITQRKRAEQAVHHMAVHDALTGLLNRRGFTEALDRAIAAGKGQDQGFAVALFDLDGFKAVNDTYGHPMGDRFLECIGALIEDEVRAGDVVGRLGGDEFAVLFSPRCRPEDSTHIAERIIERLRRPIVVDGAPLTIGTSIGIGVYPDHGTTAEALLSRIDRALYRAKEGGKGRVCTVAA